MLLNLFYEAGITMTPKLYNKSLKRKIKNKSSPANKLHKISAN